MTVPIIVAHRGLSSRYPENTRLAIEQAVLAGARAVEFDVQFTADLVPVLFHDPTLERLLGQQGRVMETPWKQLRKYRTAFKHGNCQPHAGLPITTLAEITDYCQGLPEVMPCIEIKTESIEYFGLHKCLNVILQVVEPLIEHALFLSFNHEAITWLHIHGITRTGWVLDDYCDQSRTIAEALQPHVLVCDQMKLQATTGGLWPGPWDWMAYQTEDPGVIRQLLRRGIRYVETDNILAVAAAMPEMFAS